MLLSLIVATHFRSQHVRELLESIQHQAFDLREVEVLLVSNFSDPALEELTKSSWDFSLRLLVTHQKGINIARNKGLKEARGEILYFLDDDCILPNETHFHHLMQAHAKHSTATGVGGYYLLPSENVLPCDRAYHLIQMTWQETTATLIGGNASYKRYMFPSEFLFDESLVFGGTENSFNKSLRAAGHQLHLSPELSVIHKTHLTASELIAKAKAQSRERGPIHQRQGLSRFEKVWTSYPVRANDLKTLFYVELYRSSSGTKSPNWWLYMKTSFKFWPYIFKSICRDLYLDILLGASKKS